MKKLKTLTAIALTIPFLASPFASLAADAKAEAKAKPYPLETCVVTGEKLGEMGKPFVFTHEGREIKLCCKSCQKDFDKEPAKFIKKIEAADAKAKEKK